MKLFNGWRLSISYNGDPTRDMYAKRLTIYLLKDKEYIKTEEEEKEVWIPLLKDSTTSTGYKL
tara:strand:- start:455 stop:643 length:189 start_codon:yes stop_codon:yes gene_type:complete